MLFIGVVSGLELFGDLQAAGMYMVNKHITRKKLSAIYMLNYNSKISSDKPVSIIVILTDTSFLGS